MIHDSTRHSTMGEVVLVISGASGAAYGVSVPPIEILTNNTPNVAYLNFVEIFSPKYIVLIGKIPSVILGLSGQFQANEENGFIGSYLGTPTIEIEGIRSMMKSPERKRRTWNNLKLLRKKMDKDNE